MDTELAPGTGTLPDPMDLETGPGAPFTTAAEAYQALRAGTLDPSTYGGGPAAATTLRGASFVLCEIFWELAHRYGDELLLWDGWGAIPPPGQRPDEEQLALLDEVAAQPIAADAGDMEAEQALYRRYLQDARLRPGAAVLQFSPVGDGPVRVDLSAGPRSV